MSGGGTAGGRIAPGVGANLISQHAQDRNQEATVYVGNLDVQMTEELVWELMTQAGPVVNVYLPKDRVTNQHMAYGFVEFRSEDDADYSIKILNMIKLFGKPIRVNKSSQDKKSQDVGANLFIGHLDPDVDEKLLYDTFSAFGMIVATPKIMRDPDTGLSKGFGFVSYETFEAADAAIEAMNNQFLMNTQINVGFALKKDGKGERHGTPAERLLAEQMRKAAAAQSRPNTLFAMGPKQPPGAGLVEQEAPPAPPAPPAEGAPPAPPLDAPPAPPAPPAPWAQTSQPGAPPYSQPFPGQVPQAPPAFLPPGQQPGMPPAQPGFPQQVPGRPPWAVQGPQPGMPPMQQGAPPPWATNPPRGPPGQRPGPAPWAQHQRPAPGQSGRPQGPPMGQQLPPGMPRPPMAFGGPPRPGMPPQRPGMRPGMPQGMPQRPPAMRPGMPPPQFNQGARPQYGRPQ